MTETLAAPSAEESAFSGDERVRAAAEAVVEEQDVIIYNILAATEETVLSSQR